MPNQEKLELAIKNLDKIVGEFQCNRQARNLIEESWQTIIAATRVLEQKQKAQPKLKLADDPE